MPDISMCRNETCPLKETCYRYKAIPNKYQWYSKFVYNNGCDDYKEIRNYE